MKKLILKILIITAVVLFPFALFVTVTECLPDQYGNTYVSALPDKCDRLSGVDGKKIVFVGGSSLPFGIRSDLIERELDGEYEVVNFGLYATLGTKLMMDLSMSEIKNGDIIILSPELNEQTYSLYFNPDSVLEAFDGFSGKYFELSASENLRLFYNYYKFAFNKIRYYSEKSAPDPIGIYRRDSFNEYGDIDVDRSNNIMVNGVDVNMPIYTDERLLNAEFIDYVNDYVEYAVSKGAQVYFNFSPANRLALKSSKVKQSQFQYDLDRTLKCAVLTDISDCIIDEGYFYDTNFHLNSSGAIYYTNNIIKNLKRVLGDIGGGDGGIDVPDVPSVPDDDPDPIIPPQTGDKTDFDKYNGEANIDYADWFEYRLTGNTYRVTGVKDEYKNMVEVIVPTVYNGKSVSTIAENAFYGCTELKRIHIGKSIRSLEGACFNGCVALERIYLYELDGNRISPSAQELLNGAGRGVKIYIPQGANYSSGYTWQNYFDRFEYFSR